MSELRELSYREITYRIRRLGFRFYRQGKGSHELWVRDADGLVIPIPHYRGKKVRKGTLRAIIREVGISVEDFMQL